MPRGNVLDSLCLLRYHQILWSGTHQWNTTKCYGDTLIHVVGSTRIIVIWQLQQDVNCEKKTWNGMQWSRGEGKRLRERRILSFCSKDSEETPKLNRAENKAKSKRDPGFVERRGGAKCYLLWEWENEDNLQEERMLRIPTHCLYT